MTSPLAVDSFENGHPTLSPMHRGGALLGAFLEPRRGSVSSPGQAYCWQREVRDAGLSRYRHGA